ncbi:MAG: NADH-quinone oxidoreductase subunit N [Deltaproteobacteria bacterium]|jgi:NADH-quinone oxidoreductase subunit N|nr:MAG: NADH-quinone oxidoreductase subunit N [Deltaproteobacteria bacterium]
MDLNEVLKSTFLITPELSLIVTGMILMVIDPFIRNRFKKELFWITVLGLLIGFALNLNRFTYKESAFAGTLSLDEFTAYFNIIFIIGALLATVISRDYIEKTALKHGEYYALILFSTSGMMLLSSAREFISLFLCFEIMSVSVYILSGFNRRSPRSVESGIKYLVLGGFSSAILLYGMALIYGASGSVFLGEIASRFNMENPLYIAGTALILAGFVFKIGAFPLHQWIPDIYEGAPMTVTGFMSVGVKAAAFAVFLRVFFEGFSTLEVQWMQVLWVISVFTMTIGNLAAIVQRSIKRMLAYSSISHAGYALVGVVASYGEKELGLSSVLYYLFAYTFMNLGAFGTLAYLSLKDRECEMLEDISGLWQRKPLVAIALGIFMFSLAGIPPTIGFFAKYRVFLSAIRAEFYWLAIIGILNSVLSAYYYLRVLVYAYMREEQMEFPAPQPLSAFAIAILSLGTLILGIFPLYSWELAIKAAESFIP